MHLLIIAALAANFGCHAFADDDAGGIQRIEKRSFSLDGRRWVTLFHEGKRVEHGGSVVSHVSTLRGKEFFEVLHNDDHDLTRWTVELGSTEGFGPVQSIEESGPSNLEVPSYTPWVEVRVHPDSVQGAERAKAGWNNGAREQSWRTKTKPAYEEIFTLALGERTIIPAGRAPQKSIVRVQSFYRQRVRHSRLTLSLAGADPSDGAFKRLLVELNGVEGELDLRETGALGEIIGFSASGDQNRIFVTTTGLVRYAFDVVVDGSKLEFSIRPMSEPVESGVVAQAASRAAKIQVIETPRKLDGGACNDALSEGKFAAE